MMGTIVVVVLNRLEQRRANQFCKKFYGQNTSTMGKRYRRVGLLDGMPHIKIARGVIIVLKKDASEMIKFIENFGGVKFYAKNVTLTPEDKKALQVKKV